MEVTKSEVKHKGECRYNNCRGSYPQNDQRTFGIIQPLSPDTAPPITEHLPLCALWTHPPSYPLTSTSRHRCFGGPSPGAWYDRCDLKTRNGGLIIVHGPSPFFTDLLLVQRYPTVIDQLPLCVLPLLLLPSLCSFRRHLLPLSFVGRLFMSCPH